MKAEMCGCSPKGGSVILGFGMGILAFFIPLLFISYMAGEFSFQTLHIQAHQYSGLLIGYSTMDTNILFMLYIFVGGVIGICSLSITRAILATVAFITFNLAYFFLVGLMWLGLTYNYDTLNFTILVYQLIVLIPAILVGMIAQRNVRPPTMLNIGKLPSIYG